MAIASGISYGPIAGRTVSNGLFSAFFPTLIYAMLGASKQLQFGPESILAVLTGEDMVLLREQNPTIDIDTLARNFSFLVGLVVLIMGVLRLGFLESVLANTVVSGLINAICISQIITQLPVVRWLRGLMVCADQIRSWVFCSSLVASSDVRPCARPEPQQLLHW